MRQSTTNTEIKRHHLNRLLPAGHSNLSATPRGLLLGPGGVSGLAGFGGSAAGAPLTVNPNDLLTAALKDTAQGFTQWRTAAQAQADAVTLNTAALQANTAGKAAGNLLSKASSFLGGGLGALPLVSGLLGLFGGGPKTTPALSRYLAPPSLSVQNSVDAAGSAGQAVYDQYGMPRTASSGTTSPPAAPHQNVTVNVQALDSQSFMDHSFDIAQAVRAAMLNLHSINDVVNEL